MAENLWGVSVNETKPQTVVVPDGRDLVLTKAVLVGSVPGPNILTFKTEQSFILGTLRSSLVIQFELNIRLNAGSCFSLLLKGGNVVHVSGYFSNTRNPKSTNFDQNERSQDDSDWWMEELRGDASPSDEEKFFVEM